MVGPPGQPEAVHGHGGNGGIGDLKFDTVMDGPGLIVGHGENGAGDQLLQLVLRDQDGPAVIDIGKLRVVLRVFRGNIEGGKAGTDGDLVAAFVHHHGDGALRQPPDNVSEELGGKDAGAGLHHIGIDVVGNAGFHIVAGERNAHTGLAEDPFDQAQTAFDSYGSGGNIQALQQ